MSSLSYCLYSRSKRSFYLFYIIGNKKDKSKYIFIKLKGTENYKVWTRKIGFALQDIGLINYANNTIVKPFLYTESECDTISKEKIEKREGDFKK